MALPSAQELSMLPASVLAAEIANIEAVLATRYNTAGTNPELVDSYTTNGKTEQRVPWSDLVTYRAALYVARAVQAIEGPTGGIGILDVRFHDNDGRCSNKWGYNG